MVKRVPITRKRKRVRRAGRGKAKGSHFERVICAQLSRWVTNGESDDVFWRSAMSGGRATVHVGKGEVNRQAGDICAVTPEGHELTELYFIECKHVRDLMLDRFILGQGGILEKFWQQVKKQAAAHAKRPIIIARQNRYPTLLITTSKSFYGHDASSWHSLMRNIRIAQFDDVLHNFSYKDWQAYHD